MIRGGSLMYHARNVYSQNGEDGVVEEIVRRLGLVSRPGAFVEFGAGNGVDLSNTLAWAERGWSGVWFECNIDSATKAAEHVARNRLKVEVIHGTVGFGKDDNLDEMLASTRVPRELDLLSIDIDSDDLKVWEATRLYRAKIVIIEINSGIALGVKHVHESGKRQGNSFSSMLELAHEKGYALACHTGNLIFVANEFTGNLGLPIEESGNPNSIFNDMWAQWEAANPTPAG